MPSSSLEEPRPDRRPFGLWLAVTSRGYIRSGGAGERDETKPSGAPDCSYR